MRPSGCEVIMARYNQTGEKNDDSRLEWARVVLEVQRGILKGVNIEKARSTHNALKRHFRVT